jgi:hypothetical protein
MGKPTVYIETSVISYLTGRPSSDLILAAHQKATQDWWADRGNDFELRVSEFVLGEAQCDDPDAARKRLQALSGIPAQERGWLEPDAALPEDTVLATLFPRREGFPSQCVSGLEPWRAQIAAWREEGIQRTTIHAALVRRYGYTGSYSAVHRFLKQLPSMAAPDVPLRLRFKPGEAAQVDFGAGPLITDVRTGETFKTWVFVMRLCGSRHQYAEVVRNQNIATWLACHRHAFEAFGGIVGRVIIDNPQCAITKAGRYDPEVQRSYADCAEGYAFRIERG